jgi:hypothetical protein
MGFNAVIPQEGDRLEPWWCQARRGFQRKVQKRFDTLVIAICWNLWKQRNTRVFGNVNQQCNEDILASRVLEDMKLWNVARHGIGVGADDGFRE